MWRRSSILELQHCCCLGLWCIHESPYFRITFTPAVVFALRKASYAFNYIRLLVFFNVALLVTSCPWTQFFDILVASPRKYYWMIFCCYKRLFALFFSYKFFLSCKFPFSIPSLLRFSSLFPNFFVLLFLFLLPNASSCFDKYDSSQ